MATWLPILTFLWMSIMSSEVTSHCVNVPKCTCTVDSTNHVIADCSRQGLQFVPKFQNNVSVIDLSFNDIPRLSVNVHIPEHVLGMNLSHNNLKSITSGSFSSLEKMEWLDLSYNYLRYTSDVYPAGLFKDLTSLKLLNLQHNNNRHRTNINVSLTYPSTLSELISMDRLHLDGLDTNYATAILPKMAALRSLDFSGEDGTCEIINIRSGFLINTPKLVNANFSFCKLAIIELKTFDTLSNLQYLNISFNEELTFAVMRNISYDLQFTDITVLDVSRIHCIYGVGTYLFIEDIIWLQNTSLTSLACNSNRLAMVESQFMYKLPYSLQHVYTRDNRLTMGNYMFQFGDMKSLQIVDTSGQYMSHEPREQRRQFKDCKDWRGPQDGGGFTSTRLAHNAGFGTSVEDVAYSGVRPGISDQRRSVGRISPVWAIFHPPPNLTEIIFEDGDLVFPIPRQEVDANNNIKIVKFKRNFLHPWLGPITNLHAMEYLDLSNNYCSHVSTHFFDDAPELRTLLINNNYLGFVLPDDKMGLTFQHLVKLKTLDLSFNRISQLGPLIFKNLTNMRNLNLSSNLLREFSVNIGHMRNLTSLNLSNNQLEYFSANTLSQIGDLQSHGNLRIDMSNNPFQCSCKRETFLQWMLANQRLFYNFQTYQCFLYNGTVASFGTLESTLIQLDRECSTYVWLIVGVVGAIVLSVSVIIGGLVYRYRWKLRYLYYMTMNKFTLKNQTRRDPQDRSVYTYDAFISYAEADSDFVTGELCRHLEDIHQLTLCLHQRDFIPGRDIAGNITNAIHTSHRTIIVLSPDFLLSDWCVFEFNMARMEGIYSRNGQNVVFMVFYRTVRPEEMPLTLMHLVETESFLEYPGDEQGNEVFWDKMADALA